MDKLNLTGKKVNILLRTMSQDESIGSYVLKDLEISGLNQEYFCALTEVYTKMTIPVVTANIASQKYLECWPHLSHIDLPKMNADSELLIGANVPEALSFGRLYLAKIMVHMPYEQCLGGRLMDQSKE